MVASRQVEIPYYKVFGRQRRKGFGALPQVIGRTGFQFLRNNVVLAAKRVGADFMEIAAAKNAEVESSTRTFKSAAKILGRQTLKKQLGTGGKQRKVIPTKPTKQARLTRRDIFTNLSR